nr:hypothetical protein [Nostoc sp. EkiNYC01]
MSISLFALKIADSDISTFSRKCDRLRRDTVGEILLNIKTVNLPCNTQK